MCYEASEHWHGDLPQTGTPSRSRQSHHLRESSSSPSSSSQPVSVEIPQATSSAKKTVQHLYLQVDFPLSPPPGCLGCHRFRYSYHCRHPRNFTFGYPHEYVAKESKKCHPGVSRVKSNRISRRYAHFSASLQFAGPHVFFFFRRRAASGITTAPLRLVTERYFYISFLLAGFVVDG